MPAVGVRFAMIALLAPLLGYGAGNARLKPPLTVLMDFEAPTADTTDASLTALRSGLRQLLGPSGYEVDVQLKSNLSSDAHFGQLVVFKMKGSCRLDPMPVPFIPDELGPLASAYTSDGEVLHFGEVECDRLRHCLQRVLGFSASVQNQQTYGSALAMVIAHEIYHMLGNEKSHTSKGLTKPALSAEDLVHGYLVLPPAALSALQNSLPEPR